MRARPRVSNSLYAFNGAEVKDLQLWADEAEVSLNAGDYLIAKQKQEIKELKERNVSLEASSLHHASRLLDLSQARKEIKELKKQIDWGFPNK